MRKVALASPKAAAILPKTIASCLSTAPELLYNWNDKLRGLVLGIAMARSLVLQSIAQTGPGNVKTRENLLSAFLGQDERLDFGPAYGACARNVLRRLRRRRLWKHNGKAVIIIDSTAHAKARSRGKVRPMPGKGKVRVHNLTASETILVPGYQEIWMGLLLSDRTVLPIARRLWSENGPDPASMNLAEEAEIRRACALVREVKKLDVILVADSGFRRKDLLHSLKRIEKIDFVIRLEGKLNVMVGGRVRLLAKAALSWSKRALMQWRDSAKHPLLSRVASRQVSAKDSNNESFYFNALCLTPENKDIEPMFLATTLTTATCDDLRSIVRLYSWRWGIETFFWNFKNGLNASSWRVFSCWEAIDRILTAAHMAYLILFMIADFCRQDNHRHASALMRRIEKILRARFARPPQFTLGRFFQIMAMDCQLAGATL